MRARGAARRAQIVGVEIRSAAARPAPPRPAAPSDAIVARDRVPRVVRVVAPFGDEPPPRGLQRRHRRVAVRRPLERERRRAQRSGCRCARAGDDRSRRRRGRRACAGRRPPLPARCRRRLWPARRAPSRSLSAAAARAAYIRSCQIREPVNCGSAARAALGAAAGQRDERVRGAMPAARATARPRDRSTARSSAATASGADPQAPSSSSASSATCVSRSATAASALAHASASPRAGGCAALRGGRPANRRARRRSARPAPRRARRCSRRRRRRRRAHREPADLRVGIVRHRAQHRIVDRRRADQRFERQAAHAHAGRRLARRRRRETAQQGDRVAAGRRAACGARGRALRIPSRRRAGR